MAAGCACDNTLRLTEEFAEKHDLSFGDLAQILGEMGGYCDCEVLLNAEERIPGDEVIGEETFQTPYGVAIEQGWYCRFNVDGECVPCSEADLYSMLDLNRAAVFLWA